MNNVYVQIVSDLLQVSGDVPYPPCYDSQNQNGRLGSDQHTNPHTKTKQKSCTNTQSRLYSNANGRVVNYKTYTYKAQENCPVNEDQTLSESIHDAADYYSRSQSTKKTSSECLSSVQDKTQRPNNCDECKHKEEIYSGETHTNKQSPNKQ